MNKQTKNTQAQSKENKSTKKSYKRPELTEHGSLAELTQFGGSNAADFFGFQVGGGGGMGMGMGMN